MTKVQIMSLIKFKDRLPNVNWVELSEYKDLVCSYRCFLDKLISFACVSSKTHLQAGFFVFSSQIGVMVPGVPSGDLGNWE